MQWFVKLLVGKTKDLARWLAECETELEKSKEKENKMYQAMFQAKAWLRIVMI